MTVCIAAISVEGIIVTVSDTMVSTGVTSADRMVNKSEPFHKEWSAMMSADDLTQCIPIIDKAKKYFSNRANTLAVARASFKAAYRQHLIEMKEDAVLSGYGLTMKTFLALGKRRFTEYKFNDLCARMEKVNPNCQFIVHGFDADKRPHIFCVHGDGTDGVYDKPGFCVIGSGGPVADGMLYYLNQSSNDFVVDTIYNCCVAKFMAERSDGVGKFTYLNAKQQGKQHFHYKGSMVAEIRQLWEEKGQPRRLDEAFRCILDGKLEFT